MAVSYWKWLNRGKALLCCIALSLLSCLKVSARLLGAKQCFNKERFQLAGNLRSARCSPFAISKVLAARMRKLITARARKNKRTARMLANARKDHSLPLTIKKSGRSEFVAYGYGLLMLLMEI